EVVRAVYLGREAGAACSTCGNGEERKGIKQSCASFRVCEARRFASIAIRIVCALHDIFGGTSKQMKARYNFPRVVRGAGRMVRDRAAGDCAIFLAGERIRP